MLFVIVPCLDDDDDGELINKLSRTQNNRKTIEINEYRQGLEKMEREKQRQAERDREMKERDEKRRQEKLIEQNLLMQLNANESSPKLPAKSKFVCQTFELLFSPPFLSIYSVVSTTYIPFIHSLLQKVFPSDIFFLYINTLSPLQLTLKPKTNLESI